MQNKVKWFVSVMGVWAISLPVLSADIYLEGISILGVKKTAFLSVDNEKVEVVEGDAVSEWVVEKINQRSIFLRGKTSEGSKEKGELKELALHSRLGENVVPSGESEQVAAPAAPKESAIPQPSTVPQTFKPPRIDPKTVPPGHHIVSTPFGDVLVKDSVEVQMPSTPFAPPSTKKSESDSPQK